MKLNLFSILLFIGIFSFAQYTYVPDDNFEQALIDLGYDDELDNQVLTSNIEGIEVLNLFFKQIHDFTGIEDFTALKEFTTGYNHISSGVIDLSQNVNLEIFSTFQDGLQELDLTHNINLRELYVSGNSINSLDLSQNLQLRVLDLPYVGFFGLEEIEVNHLVLLERLSVYGNNLTNLNISNLTNLKTLVCYLNNLTFLDLSNNPNLEHIDCYGNDLTGINLKNNNNTGIEYLKTLENPNLLCIDVDDEQWMEENLSNRIDPWTSFSLDCDNMSTQDENLNEISIYPNPTNKIINFSEELKELNIYDLAGKLILKGKGNQINISNLPNGMYLIKGITNFDKTINQKFIKN